MPFRTMHLLITHVYLVRRLGRRDALPRDGGESGAPKPPHAAHGNSIVVEETWAASSRMPGNTSA